MITFKFPYLWDNIQSFYDWLRRNDEASLYVEFVVDEATGWCHMHVYALNDMTALLIKMEFADIIIEQYNE